MNAKVNYFHADANPGDHVGLMDYWIFTAKRLKRSEKFEYGQSILCLERFLVLLTRASLEEEKLGNVTTQFFTLPSKKGGWVGKMISKNGKMIKKLKNDQNRKNGENAKMAKIGQNK